jgi:lipopolysaccharide transport system ATP-binding protein
VSDIIIKLENISKQYRLGQVGTQTLRGDFQRWWHRMRGKEDPTLKIGSSNKLDSIDGEYVWALKDINLEIKQGEVLGIIGKNGAGKSTLLKLLSRVTVPTTGKIKVKGRIASLLEVGTGFHPDLTGHENIFLNGAILGMTKTEIKSKFDEIVDFAGVAKYIDTPVKRYSSGMYVRLAFAVAAHLEPDILVVDEVLAVGDAEFQKKAIGKMQDISSGTGRTVLFVSHNMAAVSQLCPTAILLKGGNCEKPDRSDIVIKSYLTGQNKQLGEKKWEIENAPGDDWVKLLSCNIIQDNCSVSVVDINKPSSIEIKMQILQDVENLNAGINIYNTEETCVFDRVDWVPNMLKKGTYIKILYIPEQTLAESQYSVLVHLTFIDPTRISVMQKDAIIFETIDSNHPDSVRGLYKGTWPGVIRLALKWSDYNFCKTD